MKTVHLANVWKIYQNVVHHTLFLEIVHQLPGGLAIVLAGVWEIIKDSGATMAFILAMVVSLLVRRGDLVDAPKRRTGQGSRGRSAATRDPRKTKRREQKSTNPKRVAAKKKCD